jgi:hypothetical protein
MHHGSIPGKECISTILNKQLTFGIVRHTKTIASFIGKKSMRHYHRLVYPLLLLQLIRLGATPSSVEPFSQMWMHTNQKIKNDILSLRGVM